MKKRYFITVLLLVLSNSIHAQFLGEIRLFAGDRVPRGWLKCEGQILPISQNAPLYNLLGTMYGGDGRTTFALPDYRGRTSIGPSSGNTQGKAVGEESVILTNDNLPEHNHVATVKTGDYTYEHIPTATTLIAFPKIVVNNIQYPVAGFNTDVANVTLAPSTTSTTGKSVPINLSQPSLVVNYFICTAGNFPNR